MGTLTEARTAEIMTDRADDIIATPEALGIPWIDSPFFKEQLEAADASDAVKEHARNFHRDGFVVLEGFFGEDLVERVLGDYERIFATDTAYNADPEKDAWFKRDATRRQDAWIVSDPVHQMACHPEILGLLGFLYRRRPIPFQTLNFHTGTEQSIHSDAIHFDSLPTGFMCGVWVALEDMTLDNGALRYYPGSHRLPVVSVDQLGLWANSPTDDLGPEYELYEDWVRALIRGCQLEEARADLPQGLGAHLGVEPAARRVPHPAARLDALQPGHALLLRELPLLHAHPLQSGRGRAAAQVGLRHREPPRRPAHHQRHGTRPHRSSQPQSPHRSGRIAVRTVAELTRTRRHRGEGARSPAAPGHRVAGRSEDTSRRARPGHGAPVRGGPQGHRRAQQVGRGAPASVG